MYVNCVLVSIRKNLCAFIFFLFFIEETKKHTTNLNDIISYQIAFYMFIEVLIVLLLSFTSILSHINTIHHKTTSAPIKLFLRLHTLNFCNFLFSLLVDFFCLSRSHWCYFSCVKLRPSNILTVESVTKWLDNSNAQWHVINLASSFFFQLGPLLLPLYVFILHCVHKNGSQMTKECERANKNERARGRDSEMISHTCTKYKLENRIEW